MRVTIDDGGRITLPMALQERLHLAPGSELEAVIEGDRLVATPVPPEVHLVEDNGRLVATTTQPVPRMTQEELLRLIDEDRDGRR
jgi:AbrB family looped-hinge helix DNA binding protein